VQEQTAAPARQATDIGRAVVRRPGSAERDPERFAKRRKRLEISLAIGVPVALIALWQVAAVNGWIDRTFYPAPSDIIAEGRRLFRDNPKGNMWNDVAISLQRIGLGYLFGVVSGLLFGYGLGMSRILRAAFEPTLSALYTVPKLALLPIFLIVFGFREKPVVAVLAVTVFFFVWISSMAAVMSVDEGYLEAARSFGASKWQLFRHAILPASLPQVFVGLRIAAGVTVLTLIGVEFVFAPGNRGIGYRINNARQILDPKQAYVGLVVAAIMGVVFTFAVKWTGRAVAPWAPHDDSGPQG
jgi:sulfonate transport system permease protein